MPLEDEIIPDENQRANRGDSLHNFLDSAQNVLAEAVAKSAAEKVVDGMFSPGHHVNQGAPQPGAPQQEGLYPDLDRDGNRNKDPNFMDTAQNAFADAFAKRAAEKVVDGILPSNNNRQPAGNYGPPDQGNSGFDLGSLGSSLLESLAGQVMHPSEKQSAQHNLHQQGQGKEQAGFDFESVGTELLGLAGQMLHNNQNQDQQRSNVRQPPAQGENQSGFDFGKVGSELLGSLAEQVLHPDKKVAEQQHQPPLPQNQDNNQSGFDIGKVGAELLESLAEQVLHPSDKKENAPVQQQSADHRNQANQQAGGDIGSILGSLAENVLGGNKHNQETPNQGNHPPQHHSLSDSAGDIASSLLGSLAESMLHKNSDNESQQYQGPNSYGPRPQGYGPGPQGYGPGPQGYGPGPEGYGPGPQGYGPGPEGYGPGPQGYGPGPQGYGPGPHGYGPGPQGYGPWSGPRDFGRIDSQGGRPANPREGPLTEDINAFSSSQNHRPNKREDDESPAAELGSFLLNSIATKVLQPRQ